MQMHSRHCQAAAAARCGNRHARQGKPCQDVVFLLRQTDRDSGHPVSAAVLCDGAGSAAFSREGAQAASRAAAAMLTEQFSRIADPGRNEAGGLLLEELRQALREEAQEHRCLPYELASTLAAVAVDETTRTALTVHLGDGVILGLKRDGKTVCLSRPENGRFCNETWFTTSRDAAEHLRIGRYDWEVENLAAVYLSSDGLALSGAGGTPLPGLEVSLARLAVIAPQAAEWYLERMLAEEAKYGEDDLSMAFLSDRNVCPELPGALRRDLGMEDLSDGCLKLLRLLREQENCTTVQAARRLRTCPRRIRIWRDRLLARLLTT